MEDDLVLSQTAYDFSKKEDTIQTILLALLVFLVPTFLGKILSGVFGAQSVVAGTNIEETIASIKELNAHHISCTVDNLGEFVANKEEATATPIWTTLSDYTVPEGFKLEIVVISDAIQAEGSSGTWSNN